MRMDSSLRIPVLNVGLLKYALKSCVVINGVIVVRMLDFFRSDSEEFSHG